MKKILTSKKIMTIIALSIFALGTLLLIIGLHLPIEVLGGTKIKLAQANNIFSLTYLPSNLSAYASKWNSLLATSLVGASFMIISTPAILWAAYLWIK